MGNIRIDVLNQSVALTDAQVKQACEDIQIQITRDFEPIWITGAQLNFVPQGQTPPAGGWQMIVLDNSDQADALGYHELTSEGLPLGKVFAKTTIEDGENWTVTLSHEILEMIVDPYTIWTSFDQTSAYSRAYSLEVADPVEDDSIGYKINNTLVSNFVTPQWFNSSLAANSAQFDFMKVLNMPVSLAKGGYCSYIDMSNPSAGWQQSFADKAIDMSRSRSKARLDNREIPRDLWRKSTR